MNSKQKKEACKIIKYHYNLNREISELEMQAEIDNINRRGRFHLDDDYLWLAANLEAIGIEFKGNC